MHLEFLPIQKRRGGFLRVLGKAIFRHHASLDQMNHKPDVFGPELARVQILKSPAILWYQYLCRSRLV